MIVTTMSDQSADSLISPLSLSALGPASASRFASGFASDLIAGLNDITIDASVIGLDPMRFPLVCAVTVHAMHELRGVIDERGCRNVLLDWFSLAGSALSFWVCLNRSSRGYFWYRSHCRFSLLRFADMHDRYAVSGADGLREMIELQLLFSLQENHEPIRWFTNEMLVLGDIRI